MSILDSPEAQKARVGPRELKDPRSREYAIQTLAALKRYAESLRFDQERVEKELERIDQYQHWKILGYPSREAMLETELNEVGQRHVKVAARIRNASSLYKPGRPPKGSHRPPLAKGSNSAARLAARLKRDHPDIVARIEAGEFKSIRAAAIAAGIVRPTATIPIDSAENAIKALSRRFTIDELYEAIVKQ